MRRTILRCRKQDMCFDLILKYISSNVIKHQDFHEHVAEGFFVLHVRV